MLGHILLEMLVYKYDDLGLGDSNICGSVGEDSERTRDTKRHAKFVAIFLENYSGQKRTCSVDFCCGHDILTLGNVICCGLKIVC